MANPERMSIVRSWTEFRAGVEDLRALLAFRSHGLSVDARRRLRIAGGLVLLITAAFAVVPAFLREPLEQRHVGGLAAVLPSFYLAFLGLAIVSAVVSGGGREVIPHEQAAAFPISTLADHLGALLLAPLNIAWLMQAWTLLAATSYVLGPDHLWATLTPIVLWIAVSTALGQAIGWLIEGVRRGTHGIWIIRGLVAVVATGAAVLVLTRHVSDALDVSPTVQLLILAGHGTFADWLLWALGSIVLLLALIVVVLGGAWPARWALQRPLREELRLDSGRHLLRSMPKSDLGALVRLDRAAVWRSVPLRRGVVVLALMPGLVALAGHLEWDLITILPGLVASGGALLFGVNAWSLDGRGALWRETLPVSPQVAFVSKALVLFEVLLVAATATILLGALRAGAPTSAELAATICAALVVSAQVSATSLRWSLDRPFSADLRSARATPAPPVVMVGYSARLAAWTTLTGLVFSGLAFSPDWRYPTSIGVVMLCWAGFRISRTSSHWQNPLVRSRVIATVAA